jgi:flagellar M-ring protein FliF
MRKKVEDQLGVSSNFNEDDLKHEVILEKVKNMAEESPEEIGSILEALLSEESEIPTRERK